jgi:hypothetical protein
MNDTTYYVVHLVSVEDDKGDIWDYNVYCSDYCARSDANYVGWNGGWEWESEPTCTNCGGSELWRR